MTLAFAAAVSLLVVSAVSYRGMAVSIESNARVRHTYETLTELQDWLSAMQSVESSYRTFVLTGSESYLESYRAAVSDTQRHQTRARRLMADTPEQESRLSALDTLADQKLKVGETVIRVRRTMGLAAAAESIRNGSGQQIMDEFRRVLGELQTDEWRLLIERNADTKRRVARARTILILGDVLGVLIAAAAVWSSQRASHRRRSVEEALRNGEEQYRMLLDGVRDYAIFMMDPQGRIVSWNAGAERVKGYRADQIIGHDFASFFPAEDIERGRPEEVLRMTAANGHHEERAMRVRKDGTRFLAGVTTTALRDPAGRLRGFAEFSHDLSERKASEERYRGLLEAAPDAMVVVDQRGEIVLLNVQAEKQFGYHRDELVGQKVRNIIPEGFAERLIADALRSAEDALAQQIGTGIELTGRRKDGSDFPIEIMLSPLASADGILVTAAIRDVTSRKEAEAQLLQKLEALNRSNEELQQFAYVASHDLQEPLRMVASYTQLLSRRYKGKLDADADEFIAFAVDGASRMQRLIQDLLAYSRVGSRGQDLVHTSSEAALQQALTNLRCAIEETGAVVTHDPLPPVLADEMQLTHLFQNLVGNAIKYQDAGIPRVHVAAVQNGGARWMFSVQDNGLGIDPQYFDRIFGMFQRLHKRKEFAGTGIGLAICKKIVERHGGTISVESQPGQGSTFRFGLAASKEKS